MWTSIASYSTRNSISIASDVRLCWWKSRCWHLPGASLRLFWIFRQFIDFQIHFVMFQRRVMVVVRWCAQLEDQKTINTGKSELLHGESDVVDQFPAFTPMWQSCANGLMKWFNLLDLIAKHTHWMWHNWLISELEINSSASYIQ